MANTKDEFRNTSDGWLGVTMIDGRGDPRGIAVEPGGSVWLSEDEQIATANAPRSDGDNPFVNGSLELVARATEVKNRRPFGTNPGVQPTAPQVKQEPVRPAEEDTGVTVMNPGGIPEETGATPVPNTEPEVGQAAPGEEVATPSAVEVALPSAPVPPTPAESKPATRRRKANVT